MKSSHLVRVLFGLIILLTAACQTTDSGSSTNLWRRPEYFGGPKKSVAVAVLAYRQETRINVENALVAALRQRGVDARTTYSVINTQTIVSNKAAAIERAKALHVDAILAVRMVDRQTLKIFHFSSSNAGTGLPPWTNWFDFFRATSAYSTNPSMAQPGHEIGVMATFYENPTGDLLWFYTFAPKVTGQASQGTAIAASIVSKLQSAVLIP